MSEQHGFVIREWGEGFWKWTCTERGRTGTHSGIIGRPFGPDDARRIAREHWAEAHPGSPPPREILAVDAETQTSVDHEQGEDRGMASILLPRLRDASEQRREQQKP